MKPRTRRRLLLIGGFTLYFGLLWSLWYTPLVYPLKVFVVLLHEVSHGVIALATGGSVEAIVLDPNEGGACYCPGGNTFLTLSAGYLGSLGWGVLFLLAADSRRVRARALIGLTGGVILALTLLYLRGWFGVVYGLLFGTGLVASARLFSEAFNRAVVRVLGMTSALYVLLDIRSDILQRPHLRSDAAMLADLTGVPTLLWGLIWMAVALFVVGWLLERTWRRA
ncbi:MAG: M50 family metallopeptidase [Longimicrobiales bacterium]|nr:M50 family metallopeptidase [Longimicrobiales bacterium]